jgi:predicted small secreted protein
MRMNKVEIISLVLLILVIVFMVTGCSTIAGVGQDIKGAAEWTHDKMTEPAKKDPAK